MSPINSVIARFAPMLFVVTWATGFIVARLVAPHIEPLTFLLLRYLGAIVALVVIAVLIGAVWPKTRRNWVNGLISGVLLHGFYLGGVFWAVRNGMPDGIASLIAGLQPIATAALVGPLLGEHVSGRRWLGVIVGLIGAVLVIMPKLGIAGGSSARCLPRRHDVDHVRHDLAEEDRIESRSRHQHRCSVRGRLSWRPKPCGSMSACR